MKIDRLKYYTFDLPKPPRNGLMHGIMFVDEEFSDEQIAKLEAKANAFNLRVSTDEEKEICFHAINDGHGSVVHIRSVADAKNAIRNIESQK